MLCIMNNSPIPSTPPREQFVRDVLPPYDDFLTDTTLEHRARAAANAQAHFAEHVFVYYDYHDQSVFAGTTRAADFVSHLAQTEQCEELDIIWDFALAGKHRFLDRSVSRQRHITTATNALPTSGLHVSGSTDAFISGSTEASIPDATAPLRLKLLDGREPLIVDVLRSGISFWNRWLP